MTILLWFVTSPLGRSVATIGLIVIGILAGWLIFATHYENKGYAKAVHAIAAQDQKAISERNKALATVQACRDSGGTWNVESDSCSQ